MESIFSIQQLTYNHILNIPTLKIHTGKITCIIGESGAGKSTLLKLLNQMISQDQGNIFYKGKPIEEYNPILLRREVAMIGQHPIIFDGNVEDNLTIGRKFAEKTAPSIEEMKKALEIVHLRTTLHEDPSHFSGGEKQRLQLARILLLDPEVFLLDEPTSALDNETEDLVMSSFLQSVKEKGKTVIMVTHSVNAAKKYADIMIKIKSGKIEEIR